METINKKVILIAVILALFSTFLIYAYIRKATVRKENDVEYYNVYVAARTLPAKHTIMEDDIKQIKVTKEYVNPKAILNKADIVGQNLKESIIEGEQILKDRILDENKLTLAFNIPDGKRAVSINVNEQIAVGKLIRPGDFVDVIATFPKEEVDINGTKVVLPAQSTITIQNLQVLALGQKQSVEGETLQEELNTVTLAVTPEEAEKLVFCTEFAAIRLALRPVGDEKITNTSGATRNSVAKK